ncbi:MAG: MerR family transcriptional regulator [Deltaproteobacteria bacterium]|jgi:DNA-binding transcriptional MerR regulator|nr:MerR family transcriptional regulator [Deltaproteobacteria bacterium]
MEESSFTLERLAALTGLSRRTVRYYIQIGILSHPLGEGRGAYYTLEHLEQLLKIKKLTSAGYSLEAVRRLIEENQEEKESPKHPKIGSLEVRSHVYLAPGIEMVFSVEQSGLTAKEIRALIEEIFKVSKRFFESQEEQD